MTEVSLAGLYRHYKGGLYKAVGYGHHTETDEVMVVYHGVADSTKLYCRPATMWFETVEVDGHTFPRFQAIDGEHLISQERKHQIEKGYTPDHDDQHTDDELAQAAASCLGRLLCFNSVFSWPWDVDPRKDYSKIKLLTVAGAFITAEIDRRLRKGETP